jgi:hypothetical protein
MVFSGIRFSRRVFIAARLAHRALLIPKMYGFMPRLPTQGRADSDHANAATPMAGQLMT